jgi:hypothetical protein
VPAPRKKIDIVKTGLEKFLGLGNSSHNSPSTPKTAESHSLPRAQPPSASPSLSRKALAPIASEPADIRMESLEEGSEAAKPLQHPTKSRAKRPNNRQRPSKTGNPQAVVESVEQEAENLDVPMASSTKERQNSTKEILIVEETDCNVEGEPAKKQSPNHQLNQPKIK